jgi:hypothetical protein
VFEPARFVSRAFSVNLPLGFVLANIALVMFGAWCYFARVRLSRPGARGYAWFWTCLELANGVGHVMLAVGQGAYFPGVGTAPLLIVTSCYLGAGLMRSGRQS